MFSCQQCGYTTDVKSNFTRHMKRKTGCGLQNVHSGLQNVHSGSQNVHSGLQNVHSGLQILHDDRFSFVDESRVKCTHCTKIMTKLNMSRHIKICKGVPTNTCEYCFNKFTSLQAKCNHRKRCGQNPDNTPPTIQPTIINNNITNHITNHITNITIKFGNEDMSYIEGLKEVDERYTPVLACFSDTLDLAFFNSDHPENQTVRKTNKKSDLIELRVNQDDWAPTESKVAIPKIKLKLEALLNIPIDSELRNTNFKDMLHSKTQRGPRSEERILERHNGPPLQCNDEQMTDFKEALNQMHTAIKCGFETKDDIYSTFAMSTRQFIMELAKENGIRNFNMRNAHIVLMDQLEKLF